VVVVQSLYCCVSPLAAPLDGGQQFHASVHHAVCESSGSACVYLRHFEVLISMYVVVTAQRTRSHTMVNTWMTVKVPWTTFEQTGSMPLDNAFIWMPKSNFLCISKLLQNYTLRISHCCARMMFPLLVRWPA
jgi:hypothetical protein